jgi:hypothetical protein
VATAFRFSGGEMSILISHRAYEFGYIAIGGLFSVFFIYLLKTKYVLLSKYRGISKLLFVVVLLIVILVGPMAGGMHPGSFSRVKKVVSPEALSINDWINDHINNEEYIIGDQIVRIVISGYGDSLIVMYPDFYSNNELILPDSPIKDLLSDASYVVTYLQMNEYYGQNSTRFDNSPSFQKIYSNGVLSSYHITGNSVP